MVMVNSCNIDDNHNISIHCVFICVFNLLDIMKLLLYWWQAFDIFLLSCLFCHGAFNLLDKVKITSHCKYSWGYSHMLTTCVFLVYAILCNLCYIGDKHKICLLCILYLFCLLFILYLFHLLFILCHLLAIWIHCRSMSVFLLWLTE